MHSPRRSISFAGSLKQILVQFESEKVVLWIMGTPILGAFKPLIHFRAGADLGRLCVPNWGCTASGAGLGSNRMAASQTCPLPTHNLPPATNPAATSARSLPRFGWFQLMQERFSARTTGLACSAGPVARAWMQGC